MGNSCSLFAKLHDRYGDGWTGGFLKSQITNSDGTMQPPSYITSSGFFDFDPSLSLGDGDSVTYSIIPGIYSNNQWIHCDISEGDTNCNDIQYPWEIAWSIGSPIFALELSDSTTSYYGGVDSELTLLCNSTVGVFTNLVDFAPFSVLNSKNIQTQGLTKPLTVEKSFGFKDKGVCPPLSFEMFDVSGNGWFTPGRNVFYSEYVVSSDNEIVLRGTMSEPAFQKQVEVKM